MDCPKIRIGQSDSALAVGLEAHFGFPCRAVLTNSVGIRGGVGINNSDFVLFEFLEKWFALRSIASLANRTSTNETDKQLHKLNNGFPIPLW